MLKNLELQNVGPSSLLNMELGSRMNVLTGDNGLGKSFLLDVAWWALTRTWPAEVNRNLSSGRMARPHKGEKDGRIAFSVTGKNRDEIKSEGTFDRKQQRWILKRGRPGIPGLVIYAQVDGGFSVWDPARNYWSEEDGNRTPAFVFTPQELWNGLINENKTTICNGLIRDWASWQKENGETFSIFNKVLQGLSASPSEIITPGKLTRVSIDDARDIPSILMPYGQEVPILHASAGVKRILGLGYLLLWAWSEHQSATEIRGEETTNRIVFLIDEIECHLHPRWQRTVLGALLTVVNRLSSSISTQVVCATHSPLVMTSLEDFFDADRDAWFDLDLEEGGVKFQKRTFYKRGNAENWLTGEAFDMKSSRSAAAEQVVEEVSEILLSEDNQNIDYDAIEQMLQSILPEGDAMLQRLRYLRKKRT